MKRTCAFFLCGFLGFSALQCRAENSPEVKKLLLERLDVLTSISKQTDAMCRNGVKTYEDAAKANFELAIAKVELAETKDERLKALDECLTSSKRLEDMSTKSMNAGIASSLDVALAKKLRIDVEIRLQREKESK